MIAFATLLLGLISGVYPIEVTVSGPVAAVEFTLDGAPAGRIEGPPWIARVNLGPDLRPRVLTAHALDAEGREVAQVTQWLNLPRPPAEVDIVLEKGPEGPIAAHLTWQSVSGVQPVSVALTLDGDPLVFEGTIGAARAPLPSQDLKSLHVLSAELWFPPGVTARKDVVFGGEYGSEVSTELTAVPVRVENGSSLPELERMQGWFSAESQILTAAAIENGPGKVVFVQVPPGSTVLREILPGRRRKSIDLYENELRLGKDDRVRFLSLAPDSYRDSRIPAQLFDMSTELTREDGGVLWLLTKKQMLKRPESGEIPRVADAVAVAGLQASAENHRRAVVLVVGNEVPDASLYDPATVRRYLESIRVPLFVWSLYGPDAPAARAWGQVEDISTVEKLGQAVIRLRAEMASQKVVWVEGRHLPQAISLTPAAKGVELVARPVPQP